MSNAPNDRQLVRAVRHLAAGQLAINEERVIYLGPHGELLDGGPRMPSTQLFARRDSYLKNEQLGAVCYLGKLDGTDLIVSVVEVWETKTKRSTHVLLTALENGTWIQAPEDFGDQWARRAEGGEAKEEPKKQS